MKKEGSSKREEVIQVFSKENTWVAKLNKNEFEAFKKEGSIKKEHGKSKYIMIFTDNEMETYIKERDNGKCYKCGKECEKINWLIPNEMGGYNTPANKVLECKECFKERKNKSQTELFEDVKKTKEKNIKDITKRINKEYKCQICNESKEYEQIKFLSKSGVLAYCKKCFEKTNDGTIFIINEIGSFVGTGNKEYLKEYWEEGRMDYESRKVAKIFTEKKKKKCILCGKMRWNNSFKKKENGEKKAFCKTCEKEKSDQGIISLLDINNKKIAEISTDEEKELVKKGYVEFVSKKEVRFKHKIISFLYKAKNFYEKKIKRKESYIIVSITGKWSSTLTKEEAEQIIKENLAEFITEKVIRITYEIEEFKNNIMLRDKNTCKFCNGKGTGVYSEGKVRMYANSFCTCLDCEYENIPKRVLKWLNISEEPLTIFTRGKRVVKIKEKNTKRKYRISKEKAKILEKEGMIKRINLDTYALLYTPKEFRYEILKRDNNICYYCGEKGETIDHIIPKSKKGLTTFKNCVCACEPCNNKKGSLNKEDFISTLGTGN